MAGVIAGGVGVVGAGADWSTTTVQSMLQRIGQVETQVVTCLKDRALLFHLLNKCNSLELSLNIMIENAAQHLRQEMETEPEAPASPDHEQDTDNNNQSTVSTASSSSSTLPLPSLAENGSCDLPPPPPTSPTPADEVDDADAESESDSDTDTASIITGEQTSSPSPPSTILPSSPPTEPQPNPISDVHNATEPVYTAEDVHTETDPEPFICKFCPGPYSRVAVKFGSAIGLSNHYITIHQDLTPETEIGGLTSLTSYRKITNTKQKRKRKATSTKSRNIVLAGTKPAPEAQMAQDNVSEATHSLPILTRRQTRSLGIVEPTASNGVDEHNLRKQQRQQLMNPPITSEVRKDGKPCPKKNQKKKKKLATTTVSLLVEKSRRHSQTYHGQLERIVRSEKTNQELRLRRTCPFPTCDRILVNPWVMRRHVFQAHCKPEFRLESCKYCGDEYHDMKQLKEHENMCLSI